MVLRNDGLAYFHVHQVLPQPMVVRSTRPIKLRAVFLPAREGEACALPRTVLNLRRRRRERERRGIRRFVPWGAAYNHI